MTNSFLAQFPDHDPQETTEWMESLDAVLSNLGPKRARYLLDRLNQHATDLELGNPGAVSTPYVNTIPTDQEPFFPGDEHLERRIRAYVRWNAAVMVSKANKRADGIGGHLSTFASSAALYEVGFNHFFKGKDDGTPGDAVYFQGHAAPGIYARAYLEGRLDDEHLDNFRFEVEGHGLSSYPHPRLMPDFWEYPTVSMGLGPINSLYHARFLKYLQNRSIDQTDETNVWTFIGDGETDEPETLGAISLAGRDKLDNLTWVINCNLQRLDGPVRGNQKIIQELEAVFRGAGWNVIKVIWGTKWDELLLKDTDGVLLEKLGNTVDGEFQRYAVETGAYIRENFFGPDPRLKKLVEHLSDEELRTLPRGGHDYKKVYAAYKQASEHKGQPTVILAKTIKGWTLGTGFEARNATHQIKKMTASQMSDLRERLYLQEEIPEEALADGVPPYFKPSPDSAEYKYMVERRKVLNGPLPKRVTHSRISLPEPSERPFKALEDGSGGREVSTTMAFVALLKELMREEGFGERVVPIIPDEARTFGMDSMFREFEIYAPFGQKYEPVDHEMLLSYTEDSDGQILEEGITEAGSTASWIAAATSYAHRGVPMVPFYTFYSMFGFQRVGDLLWAAADSRARGFLLGATAGRTTLMGEGLQHQDGHSPALASNIPACQCYDPAFAYEMSAIIKDGLKRMYVDNEDIYYYLTLYNENYEQPAQPAGDHIVRGILDGLYKWNEAPEGKSNQATLIFSGPAQAAAREAQDELAEKWDVAVSLWSATSYKRLRENGLEAQRWNRLHPTSEPKKPMVTELLEDSEGPIIAVSDYVRAVPEQISQFAPRSFLALGTDGYGRSDDRVALRKFFETNTANVVVAVLSQLAEEGQYPREKVAEAINYYGIETEVDPSWVR